MSASAALEDPNACLERLDSREESSHDVDRRQLTSGSSIDDVVAQRCGDRKLRRIDVVQQGLFVRHAFKVAEDYSNG